MKAAVIQILIEGGYALTGRMTTTLTTGYREEVSGLGTGCSAGVLVEDGAVWKRW